MSVLILKRDLIFAGLVLFLGFSCNRTQKRPVSAPLSDSVISVNTNYYSISFRKKSGKPGEMAPNTFTCGEEVSVILEPIAENPLIDSLQVYIGGLRYSFTKSGNNLNIPTENINPGKTRVRVRIYLQENRNESHTLDMTLLSDIIPDKYTYTLLNEYPHDKSAYTQGLEFHDGYLYEGTGTNGRSSIRKVELKTGEILKFKDISSEFFGEGITILHQKLFQITYRSQVGFVYNLNDFSLINKIYYQMKEGWGLSNNGSEILMSDGTNIIYFMDTTYFSVQRKIEVYDNEQEVSMLNELELINGTLYANRYTTNEIVMIDTASGKLTGRIDMSGLLKPSDKHTGIDYFNGIAWDKQKNRVFVTGKNWPKIYEVEFRKI